jgi:solute carrier family 39 (zinc transporter), member 1/2/3
VNLICYKIAAALIIFLISVVTVIYPLKTKGKIEHAETFELGEALASGIFLGVAFFHMLPNAIAVFQRLYPQLSYPLPEAICAAGFLLLLFLERLALVNTAPTKQAIPAILTTILIIHSLIEGAALGVGNTFAEALLIFIAIIAHKSSASFALCVTLMRYQFSYLSITIVIVIFSLMTPLGIGLGTGMNVLSQHMGGEVAEAVFNAFAAGTFLYISALHHVRFHQRERNKQGLLEFACLALGLASMGMIAFWT